MRIRHSMVAFVLVILFAEFAQAKDVRIGVLGLFHPKRIVIRSLGSSWAVISGCGERLVLDPQRSGVGAEIRKNADHLEWWTPDKTVRCETAVVAARDGSAIEFEISVPGKIHRRYRGIGEISVAGEDVLAVVRMDVEIAVASVVNAEIGADTPIEALKAQAVASRSFMLADDAGHKTFDFCDTTHCQFLKESPPETSNASRAARATKGIVLMYSGTTLGAMYSASCGGRTRSLQEVGIKPKDYPYFPVECPYCQREAKQWQRTIDSASLKLNSERDRLAIGRREGWSAIPGNNYRVLTQSNSKIIEGSGTGHGVGLCQFGAAAMAREGADFARILLHYYPNTTLQELK
jgi:peptidoglycan hydrolase-like amidase